MPRHGENIRKRADGRWEGRYSIYQPGKGTTQKSIYGKTYGEVKKKKQELLETSKDYPRSGILQKHCAPKGTTFEEALKGWLAEIEKSKKPATYTKYRYIYETYLEDIFTDYPLYEAATGNLQDILAAKTMSCSESIKKSIYSVVSSVLTYSEENYRIPPVHLKRGASSPSKKTLNVYTQTEQAALLRYLYKDMTLQKMGIVLCLSTGLRLGEICALKWEDIDFQSKTLTVNHTVQRIPVADQTSKTALCEGMPKTFSSQREIPLSDEVLLLLSRFRHQGTYILNHLNPLEPRTYQYQFQRYQEQAGIRRRNFHVLRHTFATNCIGNGVDVKSLSEILGHANVQITLNKYVHPTLDTKRQHMNTISAAYGQIAGRRI